MASPLRSRGTRLAQTRTSAIKVSNVSIPRTINIKRTYPVREVPDGDADTCANGLARGDDGLEVALLLLAKRGRLGQTDADVELGDRDLDAERDELAHVLDERRRHLPYDEVRLEPDAVDGHPLRLERLDEVLQGSGFRACEVRPTGSSLCIEG